MLGNLIRYHCPIICIFKFKRHVVKPFRRKVWLYEQGNYDNFRQKVHDFDWITTHDDDLNSYAEKFTNKLLNIAEECIPTNNVTIKGSPITKALTCMKIYLIKQK